MRRVVFFLCLVVLTLCTTRPARAGQVEVRADVDATTIEVGDVVTYSLHVTAHGGQATDPRPGATPGFSVRGTRQQTSNGFSVTNGVAESVANLVTSWTLHADRVGSFTLGPAEATVGAVRYRAAPVRVNVVTRGKAPPRQKPNPALDPFGSLPGTSPFDPFRSLFDDDDGERAPQVARAATDPKLALDAPRGSTAFLHAVIDKTRAVVGEQVTLSVYLYEDPFARQQQPTDVHEPTATDFVKRSLLEDETRVIGAGTANVGGDIWNVKLVRKSALFPLKKGKLAIEPMSLSFPQMRAGLRASETLHVDVTEPPTAGRPAGYMMGDVGDMSLQATVTPREAPKESAVGVTVELRGTGNLPGRLTLPIVSGVEWLEPQTHDKLGPVSADQFGGTRTFSYVARLHKEGSIDLGEIKLPHYDANKRAYRVARATLGTIRVTPGGKPDAAADPKEVVLGNMPKERTSLEGVRASSYIADSTLYWPFLFGTPFACVLALGAHRATRHVRDKRARRGSSKERLAKERRDEAESAVRSADGKAAMGAIARAIESAVLEKTGVNVRGAHAEACRAELVENGVRAYDVDAILGLLRECEDARFSPRDVETDHAKAAWQRALQVLDKLPRSKG